MQTYTELIGNLAARLTRWGYFFATAESCTGGLIAASCTDVPGSSAWFRGGVVAYADEIKKNVLGVAPSALETQGAVSGPVVRGMALGVLDVCGSQVSVAVSGVAGPDGGTAVKPVGTVWIAVAAREADGVFSFETVERSGAFPGCERVAAGGRKTIVFAERHWFAGDRASVRNQTVARSLADAVRFLDAGRPA